MLGEDGVKADPRGKETDPDWKRNQSWKERHFRCYFITWD